MPQVRPEPHLEELDQSLSRKPYARRSLKVFVIKHPADMVDSLAKAITNLFEQDAIALMGVVGGMKITQTRTGTFETSPNDQSPVLRVCEIANKMVMWTLVNWLTKHVSGRYENDIVDDGVELLVIETDETGLRVNDAWHYQGVFPTSTGVPEASGHHDSFPNMAQVCYDIPLCAKIHYGIEVAQMAQQHLNKVLAEEAANQE